jgi:hypothetical protein
VKKSKLTTLHRTRLRAGTQEDAKLCSKGKHCGVQARITGYGHELSLDTHPRLIEE